MEYSSSDLLIKDLSEGIIKPVYILHGEEAFFIDMVTDRIEEDLISESEKAFNLSILYGRDVDVKQVLDHARQFPMMADRRVVIVKEAQAMKDFKSLESYMNAPSPQTVLALAHKKKIDGRIKWIKDAKNSDEIGIFSSESIPEYRMAAWIKNYVKSQNLKISDPATEMLTQHLGTDLKKVSNEIEKIKVNIEEGATINVSLIEKYIGINRDYDVFALLKAISVGNIKKVHRITYAIEQNEKSQPLQMILPGMASYFEKALVVAQNFKKDDRSLGSLIGTYGSFVKEYREMSRRFGYTGLKRVYALLVDADGYSKGLEKRRQDEILKELVGKILLCQRTQ